MPGLLRWFFQFLRGFILFGLIVFALLLGGAAYFSSPPPNQPIPEGEALRIEDNVLHMEVRSGETAQSVGKRLESAQIIRNRHFWSLLFRLDGEHVKTGTYRIDLPASQLRIRSTLIAGEQVLVRLTIPEGFTLKRAARLFDEAGICGEEDFLAAASSREILSAFQVPGPSMEGFLFPDTYLFPLDYPAARAVSLMAENFFRRLGEIAPVEMSMAEINERVIIASIVEREYRVAEEAALMAGVFFNRLRIGMALQSCATVEYVITEIQGRPHPELILFRDLEIRNPYNTYLRPGLPPGPISWPGETALRAAFSPASTNYLYFRLINPSLGQHYFSRTLDEHIRAGTLYVKGR